MSTLAFGRTLFVVACLGASIAGANACSSDPEANDRVAADAATADGPLVDGSMPTANDGANDAAVPPSDGAPSDGALADAADAAPAWHTALGQSFNVNDVVTTPSGLTYIIGARAVGGALRGVVVRLLANGQVDPAFGTAGYADVVASQSSANQPLHGVLQANGQLVLLGVVYSSPWDFFLTRLDSAGAVDATFGTTGFTQVHVGIGNDLPHALALGANGGFLFTGLAFGATNFAIEIVVGRVLSSGALDTTFDGDGIAMTSFGGTQTGRGVGLLSQDRVLVAAQSDAAGEILLLRFTAAGALDGTFSTGQDAGAAVLPAGAGILRFPSATSCEPEGLRKDASGKWVVYGRGLVPGADAGTTRSTMIGARIDENGAVDPTFHNGGGPFYPTPVGNSYAYSFASQPSGKSVIAGGVYEGPTAPFDTNKYWPGIIVLDTGGNRDFSTLGLFKGLSIPHVYPGSDALVAPLPNGHFVAVASTVTTVEAFEVIP